jgi:16S rRNA (cytidine1402-2'-O)-methyltransferase
MGILYIVATPIGNLEDITYRAVRVLKLVDVIACEDTRQTRKLLNYYKIEKNMISYHQHSKISKIGEIVDMLKLGKNVALVSDAGTPAISDPGAELILETIKNKIKVTPIPGVSAVTTLSSISGSKSGKFLFLGFLPKKKGRQTLLENVKTQISNLKKDKILIIIYESPYRLVKTLNDFRAMNINWQVVIGREMTKKFEEIIRGDARDVLKYFKNNKSKLRGEFTICLSQE